MNRKNSFKIKTNRKLSFTRPNSSKRGEYFVKKNISTIVAQSPPLLMTIPNNSSKKLKGMGKKFEREELYQINMQLKETVNSLKVELYEAKSQIVKRERELKKKEKIIEDCYKEIHNPSSLYKENFNKAKESTLLTLCKEQYNQLKKDYDQKLEEIEILKANIKITKIKEYQIDIDVLRKEMNKLLKLYNNAVFENKMLKSEINELNEYKIKCTEQHNIINECVKKVEDYNNYIKELEMENEELENKLDKNKRSNKLIKNQNSQLKLRNEKYLKERKNRQHFKMFNIDNMYKISKLQKDLDEYIKLHNLKDQELQRITKTLESQKKQNVNIDKINVFNYQNIRHIEKEPVGTQDENINKILLLKSLLEEKQKNYDILKSFIHSLNYDPDKIIRNYDPNKSKNFNESIKFNLNENIKINKSKNENNKSNGNNNHENFSDYFPNENNLNSNDIVKINNGNNNEEITNNNESNNKENNNKENNNKENNNKENNKEEINNMNDENYNDSQLYNNAVINDQNNSEDGRD